MQRPLAITLGEPGGVGPEIVVKALPSFQEQPIVVVGDEPPLREALELTGSALQMRKIQAPEEAIPGALNLLALGLIRSMRGLRRRPTALGGRASYEYIRQAVELALRGRVRAITTAPISKEALRMAGLRWPGHTEMLAALTGSKDYAMAFVGGPLKILLATIHVPLRKVPSLIKKEELVRKIRLAHRAGMMFGLRRPHVAVAGLNPHAGEGGLFGREEIEEIAPAVAEAKRKGLRVSGPHPADVLFRRAYLGEVDVVLAMYHDQALGPLKMIAFDVGVNFTVGLPFVRTSPDHGTAYDIAWKAVASAESMKEALRLALRLSSAS
jgi:4-hydroxythreonine-4-phosphate dehydrogenase